MAGVPSQLQAAINQSAKTYGVPASLLVGIWREEAGGAYPNPYINSSGYGGLFGTTDAFGATQDQADLAASILAKGFQVSGGSNVGALSYYNTGNPDSGAGQAYAQTVLGFAGQAPTQSTAGLTVTPAGYHDNTVQDTSFTSGLEAVGEGVLGGLPVVGGLFNTAGDVADAVKVFAWLFSLKHWAMVFEIFIGVLLLGVGFFFLGGGSASRTAANIGLKDLLPGAIAANAVGMFRSRGGREIGRAHV